jgi:hypothetical protein
MKKYLAVLLAAVLISLSSGSIMAQTPPGRGMFTSPTPEASASATPEVTLPPSPLPDITQKTEETLGPLEELLKNQTISYIWPTNPIKHAIRNSVAAGVPTNTIVLLLLLPVVATVIAATRQLIGVRGFGIFLPAALSVTFVAIGPIVGISLFIIIVFISSFTRSILKVTKLRLQYLPRMALILWFVAFGILGILFASPYINYRGLQNVSIFPVLVLTLLTEDFNKIQAGKSAKTALRLTFETLLLSLVAYIFLTLKAFQEYVLLNPELTLLVTLIVNILLGRYMGLRFMEYYRFRKLINSK